LSTAIRLTPVGSGTVHIYKQTTPRTTQITTNLEKCGPCLVFVGELLESYQYNGRLNLFRLNTNKLILDTVTDILLSE